MATGGAGQGDESARAMLRWGIIAGPFYLALGVAQGLLRAGFDFSRHPLSVLANGEWGWVQTLNFAISGLMVLATVIGIGRVVPEQSRGLRLALAIYGLSLMAAAVLRADPVDGFPVGTPLGMPTSISPMGLGHFIAGTFGFTAFGVAALFGAGVMKRRNAPALRAFSLVSGLIVLLGFYGGAAMSSSPVGIAGIWLSVATGWAWLAAVSKNLRGAA